MALSESDASRDVGVFGEPGRQRLQLSRVDAEFPTDVTPWTEDLAEGESDTSFELNLLQYWHLLLKRRFLILGAILFCLAAGLAITLLSTPIYTAKATLQIDREVANVVNMQNVQPQEEQGESEEFYQTQYGLLKSPALAERVISTLGLANSPLFLHTAGLKPLPADQQNAARARAVFDEKVFKKVSSSLAVDPVRGSRLVALSFDSPDPNIAAQVANSFADNFIQTNLERRFQSNSYARDYLEKQIAIAKTRLEAAERAAVAYAIDQHIINLHDEGDSSNPQLPIPPQSLNEQHLSEIDTALAAAQADRMDAEAKWRQANAAQGIALTQVLQDPTIQVLSDQRAVLEGQYQNQMRLFRPGYPPAVQLKAQIDDLNAKIEAQTANVKTSLRGNYEASLHREQQLSAQVEGLKAQVLNDKDRSIQYNFLQREVDTSRTLYDGLLERYKEVGVTGGVQANNISIIDRADAPLKPSKPKVAINLAIALLVGVGLGALAAFIAEALDQAIRTVTDVEQKLGLPLMGAVPLLTKGVTPEEAMKDPRSNFWEAYYSIRTALQFSSTTGVPHSLVVVSAGPGEGKTTTAIALANSLARLGAKVVLVDADLRKPSLHTRLGLEHGVGLTNFLTGAAKFSELPQATENPSLFAITSGPIPPTPAELLADTRVRSFFAEAKQLFDIVIVDGPPVMGFADAPMIAAAVDGTLLVVESGRSNRGQIRSALRRLRMGQAKILGVVLAKYDVRKASYGYGQGYGYGYYAYEYGESEKRNVKKVEA
jgi:capsular exopolysaccharide synthesis family protein